MVHIELSRKKILEIYDLSTNTYVFNIEMFNFVIYPYIYMF